MAVFVRSSFPNNHAFECVVSLFVVMGIASMAGLWWRKNTGPSDSVMRASDRIKEASETSGVDLDLLAHMSFQMAFSDGSVRDCVNAKHQARQWIRDNRPKWREVTALDQVAAVIALVNKEMFVETVCFTAWAGDGGFQTMHDRRRWRREGVAPDGGCAPHT